MFSDCQKHAVPPGLPGPVEGLSHQVLKRIHDVTQLDIVHRHCADLSVAYTGCVVQESR